MAHFGPQSPRQKFPFLAPKRCGNERFGSLLSQQSGRPGEPDDHRQALTAARS